MLNLYTPVYHQHPTLSGRIPSTISTLQNTPPAYFPMSTSRDLLSAPISKDSTTISMQSIREELPSKSPIYNREFLNPSSLAWSNRLNVPHPNNKHFGLPLTKDYLSTSLPQANKPELLQNRQFDKTNGGALPSNNKITPTPVIKTSTDGENPTKPPGEKNKVKFSDTVTVAVVPVIYSFFFYYYLVYDLEYI